ncbi:MAG: MarR family transcriptional regulator [Acetatifactor sp.]
MNNAKPEGMRRFNHLLGELDATYHDIALKFGLSDSAMYILYTLCDEGADCPLSEICRRCGLSKQTVNSAIRKLETEGILYLQKAGSRGKIVCMTEAGRELAARTAMRLLNAENAILASWPPQDVKKYLDLTERFLNDIRERATCL